MLIQWLASIHCQFRDILLSLACVYLCSCMHIMSILCSTADAVSSGSWSILFKVITLNVAICIVCLHFSIFFFFFWFELCCWVFEHWSQGSNLRKTRLFFNCAKSDAVCVCGLSVGHGYLSMAIFILIWRNHYYRWVAVVPRSNWRSWALSRKTHTSRTRSGIAFFILFSFLVRLFFFLFFFVFLKDKAIFLPLTLIIVIYFFLSPSIILFLFLTSFFSFLLILWVNICFTLIISMNHFFLKSDIFFFNVQLFILLSSFYICITLLFNFFFSFFSLLVFVLIFL